MNIFVAKLNSLVNDDDLRELFEKHGTVASARVIYDRETGTSKGFGFVEMDDETEAGTAIEKLNSYELNGNRLIVKEAHNREGNGKQFQQRSFR